MPLPIPHMAPRGPHTLLPGGLNQPGYKAAESSQGVSRCSPKVSLWVPGPRVGCGAGTGTQGSARMDRGPVLMRPCVWGPWAQLQTPCPGRHRQRSPGPLCPTQDRPGWPRREGAAPSSASWPRFEEPGLRVGPGEGCRVAGTSALGTEPCCMPTRGAGFHGEPRGAALPS